MECMLDIIELVIEPMAREVTRLTGKTTTNILPNSLVVELSYKYLFIFID